MNIFNDLNLDQRASRIKGRIDSIANPSRMEELSEHGIFFARKLLEETRTDLDYIKNKVGPSSEGYIEVSEAVALAAAGCIKFPVSFMLMMSQASDFHQRLSIKNDVKSKLGEASRLMAQISAMPMGYEARQLINQVTQMISQTEKKLIGSTGCFIATFVYGDYNCKEVLILRYFRDSVLESSLMGKIFIKLYYLASPTLVILFSRIPIIKPIIKFGLKKIVNKFSND